MNPKLLRSCAAMIVVIMLASCRNEPTPSAPTSVAPAPSSTPLPAPTAALTPPAPTQPRVASATRLALRAVQLAGTTYGLVELQIDTDGVVSNRFDPALFDLSVRFTSPSGQVVQVPAFSYQDFSSSTLQPQGAPVWRVRFTPSQPGRWQAMAELTSPQLSSQALGFDIAADPSAHGFVRINKQNPRYFAFDDGTFYFPIGLNLGWASSASVLADYTRWLDRLSQNGGTIGRVWMASWSFGIEWKDTGLGNYAGRMQQAWLLDQVFKLAEQRKIYLMLTLLNHGAFSTTVNPEWKDNPYNAANGGPLSDPREFARNAQARQLFERRVRYIAARWAYSPSLFAWEWWNEVDWTPLDDIVLKPWLAEMTAILQRQDPYHHLVSSSYANGSSSTLWRLPELSFAQQHDYSGSDLAKLLPLTYLSLSGRAPRKPLLLAELGFSATDASAAPALEAIHFHNGIWAAPFSGFAGTGMYWWWDTLVDPANLWGEYASIATFMKDVDLAPLAPANAQLTPAGAHALALQGQKRTLVWLRSDRYEVGAARSAYATVPRAGQAGWKYTPPTLTGLTLTLAGLDDGHYLVRWFSPATSQWQPDQRIQVAGGAAQLAVPPFAQDLALSIGSVSP